MFAASAAVIMSSNNSTCLSEEASTVSSVITRVHEFGPLNPFIPISPISDPPQYPDQKFKKKRNLPGNPDPDAEVIALSPTTLMATNRFVCEICNKGFQRDQNLQLHRRGHNLPWKLKQRSSKEILKKKAYVCPEPSCVHHHPSRALGDLTGIKKHFCRKHGEKKWKCDKCSKIYAVQSDWKAHSKTCGTREYRCDCGTLFSRKDSFITHRAFCDALAEESARLSAAAAAAAAATSTTNIVPITQPPPFTTTIQQHSHSTPPSLFPFSTTSHHNFQSPPPPPPVPQMSINPCWDPTTQNPNSSSQTPVHHMIKPETIHLPMSSPFYQESSSAVQAQTHNKNLMTSPFHGLHLSSQSMPAHLSATALLQRAATLGAQPVGHVHSGMARLDHFSNAGLSPPEYLGFTTGNLSTWQKTDRLTRDFLGLTGDNHDNGGGGGGCRGGGVDVNVNVRNLLSFTGGVEFPTFDRDHTLLKPHGFGFAEPASETWGNC